MCIPRSSLRGKLSTDRGEVAPLRGSVCDESGVYRVEAARNVIDNVAMTDNLVNYNLEFVG